MSGTAARIADILKEAGRPLKAAELSAFGVTRMALVRAARDGAVERSAHGVYRLPSMDDDPRAAWASVSTRTPSAVFCMVSAAAYHGLTQNMAASLDVAVPASVKPPSPDGFGVSVRFMRWSDAAAFELGVETVPIDGVAVRITGPERTVVDLFRYSSLVPMRGNPSIVADPETVHDALVRYLHGFEGGSSGKLRSMAKAFGVWERLNPHVAMLNLSYQAAPSL